MGYDDAISIARREGIREDLIQQALRELAEKYHASTTAFAEETDKYAELLTKKPDVVDYKTMCSINATNVYSIGNNSYRGGYLLDAESVETAKKAGIRCVIDLTDNRGYKRRIEEGGLKYVSYDTNHNKETIGDYASMVLTDYDSARSSTFDRFYGTEEEFNRMCRLPIENFAKLIGQLNEGYCYIGCSAGTHRTDFIMMLNEAFNPKLGAEIFDRLDNYRLACCKNIYDKLTDNDKQVMGWDKDFEKLFLQKFNRGIKRACRWMRM